MQWPFRFLPFLFLFSFHPVSPSPLSTPPDVLSTIVFVVLVLVLAVLTFGSCIAKPGTPNLVVRMNMGNDKFWLRVRGRG